MRNRQVATVNPSFCIGQASVGGDAPTYVIAEAGVNHDGNLYRAMVMVEAAAATGADAVKFQAFSAGRLVTRGAPPAGYQKASSQLELLERLELSEKAFAALVAYCAVMGIEMLATPFGPEDVEMLVRLGIRAIKLASPDVTNIPLLQAAGATGVPVILSTGAAGLEEIAVALDTLTAAGAGEMALLHCVSSYPTPLAQANLLAVRTLAQRFGLPVGYSDHTQELCTGELAVRVGACILEKHFTLDRTLPGPDHAMSLQPADLADYIARARFARRGELDIHTLSAEEQAALGDGIKQPQAIEADVRRVARSSVTSAVAIPAGTRIQRSMLTIKRPAGGIPPAQIDSLPGRSAAVDIPADTTLTPEMLR